MRILQDFSRNSVFSKDTGVGWLALLQGTPTQESSPGLPQCRQTLYRLSHQGSLTMPVPSLNSTRLQSHFSKLLFWRKLKVIFTLKNWYREILYMFVYPNSSILVPCNNHFIISFLHTCVWTYIDKINFYKQFPHNTLVCLICNKYIFYITTIQLLNSGNLALKHWSIVHTNCIFQLKNWK